MCFSHLKRRQPGTPARLPRRGGVSPDTKAAPRRRTPKLDTLNQRFGQLLNCWGSASLEMTGGIYHNSRTIE
jgi:hypothetical protein